MRAFPRIVVGCLVVWCAALYTAQGAAKPTAKPTGATLVLFDSRPGGILKINGHKPMVYSGGEIQGTDSVTIFSSSSGKPKNLGTVQRSADGSLSITPVTSGTTGSGELSFSAGATYTSGATLTLSSGTNLSVGSGLIVNNNLTYNSGAVLTLASNSNVTSGVTFNTGVGTTLSAAGFLKFGTGTAIISDGTLDLGASTATVTGGSLTFVNGGTITGGATTTTNRILTLGAGSTLTAANINNLTVNGGTISGGTLTLGAGTIASTLNGTLTLTGNNIYSTGTTINTGTLTPGTGSIITIGAGPGTISGATLTLGSPTLGTGSLTLTGTVATVGLATGTSLTFNLPFSGTPPSSITVPVSTQITANMPAGTAFKAIPTIKGNPTSTAGNATSFLDGLNTNGGTVSLLYLPAVQNLVGNPLSLHISEFDTTGYHEKYVLQMSFDPTAAAALGDLANLYLAWFDPSDSTWKNAVDGDSDGGASAHFVSGAYDSSADFNLGYYGLDTANSTVWAVIDHNSTFGVANSDVSPDTLTTQSSPSFQVQTVPEPSTAALLLGGFALFVRRSRKQRASH